jgi:RimJ/RimL family protein N-acetyltransferase
MTPAMGFPTATVRTALRLTDTPTQAALQTWWEARQSDPESALVLHDGAPQDFPALCARIATGDYLFYLGHDRTGAVVGAMWLHDLVRDATGTPRAGWLGTYVLLPYRGSRTTQAMWTHLRWALQKQGVQSIYIASHHANTRAHRVAETHLGFHRVGVFPAFAWFNGVPTDCLILSMRPEDRDAAWALAHQRFHYGGLGRPGRSCSL